MNKMTFWDFSSDSFEQNSTKYALWGGSRFADECTTDNVLSLLSFVSLRTLNLKKRGRREEMKANILTDNHERTERRHSHFQRIIWMPAVSDIHSNGIFLVSCVFTQCIT